MNVLVTGGAGYIGSHTSHLLLKNQHKVTILDNLSTGHEWAVPQGAAFVRGDIRDLRLVNSVLLEQKIDTVLHFAAKAIVPESIEQPLDYYDTNTIGTLRLLESLKQADVKRLIFSSTAAVYGLGQDRLIEESDLKNPINPYGHSKLMAERMITDYASTVADFRFVTLRYFNVAGAHSNGTLGQVSKTPTHLIKRAALAAVGKLQNFTIYGSDYHTKDQTCVRDYIHVEDLALAHLDAMNYLAQNKPSDVFNCGYGEGASVKEVVNLMKEVSGVDFSVHYGARRAGDPDSLVANNQKIIRSLNWRPQYHDLRVICESAFKWEKRSHRS
jgi:UDP-glucose 4-epimerase